MPLTDHIKQMRSDRDQHQRPKHPSGWDPHVETFGDRAVAISEPTANPNPDHAGLIAGWQLDPAEWRIVGNVNCRRWQTTREGESVWLYYYKADLQRIDPTIAVDTAGLYRIIRNRKPPARSRPSEGTIEWLLLMGDTQIGKGDGDGSEGTVRRIRASLDGQIDRLKQLRKSGWQVGPLTVAFMGDMREGGCGNYPAQKFTTDLTVTQQDAVLQELIFATLDRLAPLTDRLTVLAVPGNHGEERDAGKAYTLPSDNHDVAVVQTVHRGMRLNENSAFDHVDFVYPEAEDLTVTLELAGIPVAFCHGHQFSTTGLPAKKAESWWMQQAHAKTRAGDADILFSAHFHHLLVTQNGRKTQVQIPALDGGSKWWENKTGQFSPPGMVSCLIGEGIGPAGCGIDELKVV